jgi:CRP-like cAMP-binding protein
MKRNRPEQGDLTVLIRKFVRVPDIKSYPNGTVVFNQGSKAKDVFFIHQGEIKIAVISAHGKEAVAGILSAGDFFGEGVLAGQELRISSAISMSDSIVERVLANNIFEIFRQDPAFYKSFVTHLLKRNIRIEEDLIDQLFNSSEKRLARLLLLLSNYGKDDKPETIIPKITQETLAEMIGTTRARVSFFMNKFRKLGFIEYNGKLQVCASLLSVVLHD